MLLGVFAFNFRLSYPLNLDLCEMSPRAMDSQFVRLA